MTVEFIWEALLLGRVQKRQLFMVVYSESLPHLCVTQVKLSFSLCQGELAHSHSRLTGWDSPPLLLLLYQPPANWWQSLCWEGAWHKILHRKKLEPVMISLLDLG